MWKADRTYKRIIGYLRGLLSDRERHDLEKEVMRDAFDEDAFEGLNQLSANELETDMDVMAQRLDHRIHENKKRSLSPLYLIAASFILIIGIGSVLYIVLKTPQESMITQQMDQSTPSIPTKPSPVENLESPDNEAIKKNTISKTYSVPKVIEEQFATTTLEAEESIAMGNEIIIADEVMVEKSSGDLSVVEMEPSENVKDINRVAVPATRSKKSETLRIRGLASTGTSSIIRVTDSQGQPLPGVNVVIKGTNQGTITDINGRYDLPTVDSASLLSFNYIGFVPLEVKADQISGDIIMQEDMVALNEVVVVGYGTQKRSSVTGAISTVEAKDISDARETAPYNYIKPIPPGGSLKEFRKWVDNLVDHSLFQSFPGKHRIQANLTVHANGTVSNISIRDNVPPVIADEYLRVISISPLWKPALENGSAIEVEIALRIVLEVP